MNQSELKEFLDSRVAKYNQKDFIEDDPISIPHQYRKKQDIEITGLIAAILAWGQRKAIIKKCEELFERMDNAPHDFILNHRENDLKRFLSFKHRTFNATDTLYFVHWLNWFYSKFESLEDAFVGDEVYSFDNSREALIHFYRIFFSQPDYPTRTRKHIQNPERKSACKRMNMFLRWMVRKDQSGVDFGIWKKIKSHQLICPCDLHVDRVGRKLGLITRKQTDWLTAVELTEELRKFDQNDPVKYDYALFGLGIIEKY